MFRILIFSTFMGYVLCNLNPYFNSFSGSSNSNRTELKGLIGIMVEFQEEIQDNPLTSGNGKFINELDIGFINDEDINRCSKQLLDPPPHNYLYFTSQLKAAKNYFYSISNENIDLDLIMIDNVFQLSNDMESYAYSEDHITQLYIDAVTLADDDISENIPNDWNSDDFIIVVFHAGLGQDLGAELFDPTIYDIHSAFVDELMLSSAGYPNGFPIGANDEYTINNGILMPETLNEIYFDVIEDLHPITFVNDEDLENIYCNYQLGMTGLFAYFLGYRLGFPPMHSTDNIQPVTRIGKFGLMDYGAYNGRGIIPAPPVAWSRIFHQGINTTTDNLTDNLFNEEPLDIVIPYTQGEIIYQIDIANDEYFLIENRRNKIENNLLLGVDNTYSIDDIIYLLTCAPADQDEDAKIPCDQTTQDELQDLFNNLDDDYFWLDVVSEIFDCDHSLTIPCEFIDETGVIVNFPNYDYGLPGSGLLIWHIQEPKSFDIFSGMNNDVNNKSIHLEEADGMLNIGYPDPSPFGSPLPTGWVWDYWFENNFYYEQINDNDNTIIFNNTSIPNSNIYSGIDSNISIQINEDTDEGINIKVQFISSDIDIIAQDGIKRYLGNNGSSQLYYLKEDDNIYLKDFDGDISLMDEESSFCNSYDFPDNCNIQNCKDYNLFDPVNDMILYKDGELCIVENENYYIQDNLVVDDLIFPMGYFDIENLENNNYDTFTINKEGYNYALGDYDNDGLDEIIMAGYGHLSVQEFDGLVLSGFPIYNNFDGIPLFANSKIICKTNHSIWVSDGREYPLFDESSDLFLMSANGYNYIINGNRSIKIGESDENTAYWMNPYSTTYNYPLVGVSTEIRLQNYNNWLNTNESAVFGFNQAFNYPNPFEDSTKFRFYVSNASSIYIKIYDAVGFLVDNISVNNLVNFQFNEYNYDTSKLNPGLYIAEMKSNYNNDSKIIKLLKIK